MRSASLLALALVLLGALILSGCPAQSPPGPGAGYGTPRTGMMHDPPGMGDGGQDRLHMPGN